jgi:hypothetical protein
MRRGFALVVELAGSFAIVAAIGSFCDLAPFVRFDI